VADAGTVFWLTLAGTLAAGWAATVWYQERRRRRRVRRRQRYLEGLRYLLDEKPDRALEVFHGLAALDDETVDTHFALGTLYRRSGEVERAIRVHQNIVARNNARRAASRRGAQQAGATISGPASMTVPRSCFRSSPRGTGTGCGARYLVRIYEISDGPRRRRL
jgi:hypothetical protein